MSRRQSLPGDLEGRAFTVAEAVAAGVRRHRLRAPSLHRPTYGVRHTEPCTDLVSLARATRLGLPDGCAFSHVTAAQLLGIPLPKALQEEATLHVMRGSGRPLVERAGCEGHRGLERRRLLEVHGLLVTSPEDTWCDLGSQLELDDLIVAGDHIVHRTRGLPIAQLRTAVGKRAGERGVLRLREALPWLRDRSGSPMETKGRLLIVRAGLPEPELNATLHDAAGGWIAECDYLWRAKRVVGEFDGDHHRVDRRQWQKDVSRRQVIQSERYHYVQFTERSVTTPPHTDRMLAYLADLLEVDLRG